MRQIILLGLILAILSCKNCDEFKDNLNISFKSRVIRSYDTISYLDTFKHKGFDIKLTLTNNSSLPISFWIMACSWDYNFIINNDYIKILGWTCHGNYPIIRHLKSNDSIVFKVSVIRLDQSFGQIVDDTRFGFIYIDSIKCKKDKDYMNIISDKYKQDKITWSNALRLRD